MVRDAESSTGKNNNYLFGEVESHKIQDGK